MEVAQSRMTLCDPTDCSLPGSSVHGILQARILEWVAISSSGDLLEPGIEPRSPSLQANSLLSEPSGKPVVSNSLQSYGLQPSRLLCPWDYPSKNTGVGCHFLLQGILPTQGLTPVSCTAGSFSASEPPRKPLVAVRSSLQCLLVDLDELTEAQQDDWRRDWQPTPVSLPGESRGRRSPVGYSPWGRKESDTTEQLHLLTYLLA